MLIKEPSLRRGLFLLHFKYLCDSNQNPAALHNLALALSECGLPILSVDTYLRAINLGETLSTANLAYKFLDAGMANNARDILKPAMGIVDHDPNVDKCYAEIEERTTTEGSKQGKLIEDAQEVRKFLAAIGYGLKKIVPPIAGTWRLPFGEIDLKLVDGRVAGKAEIITEESGLAGILGTGEKNSKTDIYTFVGSLTGSVCKFTLESTRSSSSLFYGAISALGGLNTREGLILFEDGGKKAIYTELKGRKIGERVTIFRTK